jgi:hypothetical protein
MAVAISPTGRSSRLLYGPKVYCPPASNRCILEAEWILDVRSCIEANVDRSCDASEYERLGECYSRVNPEQSCLHSSNVSEPMKVMRLY